MSFPVIDLFSGCGGLSLGFRRAGFPIVAGLDSWDAAVATVNSNHLGKSASNQTHHVMEIGSEESLDWLKSLSVEDSVVIGGPPCQAYSKAGRGKLNSLDFKGHLHDPRGQLFWKYIEVVETLKPVAFLMENVPDAWQYGNLNIPEQVCTELSESYDTNWTILHAADYGVPQTRERLFVIGIRKDLGKNPAFPEPSHSNPDYIPPARRMLPGMLEGGTCPHLLVPPAGKTNLPGWVTVRDAFNDLPVLHPTEYSGYHNLKLNESIPYSKSPENDFQKAMRSWPGHPTGKMLDAHSYRRTERDFPIFARMSQGDDYRDALRIARQLNDDARSGAFRPDMGPDEKQRITQDKQKAFVPPYDETKFFDKWNRLRENQPSHTVVAHLGTDTYSHIHPWEPRGISVREAARLQSFPDGYRFPGSMGDAFKQIGNAVPPLLAYAIAGKIMETLEKD